MVFHREYEENVQSGKKAGVRRLAVFLAVFFALVTMAESLSLQAAEPKVTVTKKTLYVGYTSYQIKFKNLAETAKVTYQSSDKKVATVSTKGVVKPVAKGTATITVTIVQSSKTYTRTIAVTVKEPYISISNKKTTLVQNSDYQLIGKAYGLEDAAFTFTTSNILVAKVDKETGLLHARSAGKAKITMKDTTSGKSVSFNVTVVEKTEENEGDVYISTADMDKTYVYTAPTDTADMTEEEIARIELLTDIQKRITSGASITIKEMEEYYIQKLTDSRR